MNDDRMTPEALAEIREMAERATPAPWRAKNGGLYVPNEWDGNLLDADDDGLNPKFCEEEDARFCARAREDIPALLAEAERLRTAEESLTVENARMSADLDMAIADMECLVNRESDPCDYCGWNNNCKHPAFCPSRGYRNFLWRGVVSPNESQE